MPPLITWDGQREALAGMQPGILLTASLRTPHLLSHSTHVRPSLSTSLEALPGMQPGTLLAASLRTPHLLSHSTHVRPSLSTSLEALPGMPPGTPHSARPTFCLTLLMSGQARPRLWKSICLFLMRLCTRLSAGSTPRIRPWQQAYVLCSPLAATPPCVV